MPIGSGSSQNCSTFAPAPVCSQKACCLADRPAMLLHISRCRACPAVGSSAHRPLTASRAMPQQVLPLLYQHAIMRRGVL